MLAFCWQKVAHGCDHEMHRGESAAHSYGRLAAIHRPIAASTLNPKDFELVTDDVEIVVPGLR